MKCPCDTMEDELSCLEEVCPHTFPRRGWIIPTENRIDLWSELVRFKVATSKNDARRLINGGAVKKWNGSTWEKLSFGDRFLPMVESFLIIGKRKKMMHLLIPR